MKTKILNIALASVLFVVASVANAGVITLNDSIEIEVLSLNQTFTSFYNYSNSSANAGFEQVNTAVMFLAEHNNELALFTLLDARESESGAAHSARTADLAITGFNEANVIFVDDSSESNADGFSWTWADCCTDGMIYKIEDADNFDIDLTFSKITDEDMEFTFLSFSAGSLTPQVINIVDDENKLSIQSATVPVPVPEPSTLAIFALAMIGLASRRIKKQF